MPGIRLPALPLWEPKWNKAALDSIEQKIPRGYARGYRMQVYTDAELMFPSFRKCFSPGAAVSEWFTRGYPTFIGIDLAGDKRPGNCITVVGLDTMTQQRYMLEVLYGAWTSTQMAGHISDVARKYAATLQTVMIENNGYQAALADWIKSDKRAFPWWYKIESFTTGANKMNEKLGLPSLEVEFHHKAWVIPSSEFDGHVPTCTCNWCTWVREFTQYPHGATSDGVMSTWFAREAISRYVGNQAVDVSTLGDIGLR